MADERNKIVGVALLNREDVARLGSSLKKLYKVEDTPKFADLIRALDALDQGEQLLTGK